MARLPYQPIDLQEPKELVDRIRTRRGGTLINLDRQLLHSTPFARGWNAMFGEIREGLSLSPKFRELAMCVVAMLNGAEYEFYHHAPEFAKAGGTEAQIEAIRQPEVAVQDSNLFDEAERAVIQLTIDMTRHIKVSDAVFDEAKKHLPNDQTMLELVGVIAAYNMVSRVLVVLDIQPETH